MLDAMGRGAQDLRKRVNILVRVPASGCTGAEGGGCTSFMNVGESGDKVVRNRVLECSVSCQSSGRGYRGAGKPQLAVYQEIDNGIVRA
jgi:hypothetical protein